jgi:hypothetical protein
MKTALVACIAMLFIALAPFAHAAEPYDPAALTKEAEPYLDDATLCVAHVDFTRVDLLPVAARIKQSFPKIGSPRDQEKGIAEFDASVNAAQKWIADFTKAGGRDCFVVVSMSGFPQSPLMVVVPLRQGANGGTLAKLIGDSVAADPAVITQVRENVVLLGSKAALARVVKPVAHPELVQAFEAAGDSAAQILYVPSADTRKVLDEMLPNPTQGPFASSGGPIAQQIAWMGMGIQLAPKLGFNIVIHSPDAASATALSNTLTKAIVIGKEMLAHEIQKTPEMASLIGDLDALAKAFTPAVEADRLTFHLDTDASLKLTAIILPAMAKSREQARRMRSLSNLKQLVLAGMMYANDHKNEFPPDLQTLIKSSDFTPEMLRNPRSAKGEIGYIYLRPVHGTASGAEQVVAYESWPQPPSSIAVAFADGHAQIMDYAAFEKALADSKARNEAK